MPDPLPPAGIPRRLAYRGLADACGGQARHFEGFARRVRTAREPQDLKVHGRLNRAKLLRAQAATLSRWVGDPDRYRGAIDAAAFGYLVALAYGHAEALAELRAELADQGRPGLIDGLGAADIVEIAARI